MDVYMMPSFGGFGFGNRLKKQLWQKKIVWSEFASFHEILLCNYVFFFDLDNSYSLIKTIKLAYAKRDKLVN
jgi:hypothetical protein